MSARASRQLRLYRTAAAAVRFVPRAMAVPMATAAGRLLPRIAPSLAHGLTSNLSVVMPEATQKVLARTARDGFGSYGRYWIDSMRLPELSVAEIDEGFAVEGYQHILDALATGLGPIMVLPHLGGWEWAAAWLGRVAELPVTAVVERLEPDDLFDWFVELREGYGVNVVPLGPDAITTLLEAVRQAHVVCLIADRDLTGDGVEVELFGARTTLPAGPALLARRTGATILPTAVYFEGDRSVCRILGPIHVDPHGSLRPAIVKATQQIADALEKLIGAAPGQWHVLQLNWPDGEPAATAG